MEEHRGNELPLRDRPRRGRSSSSSSSSNSRSERRRRHKTTRRRRSHSRGRRRSSRKRRRSPSRRSSSDDYDSSSCYSSSSNNGHGRGRHRADSWRWQRKSGGGRRSGGAAALLSSEPFSVREGRGVLDRPATDWVCGVCSNPNSVKREECFRCGTRFAVAVNATPSEEIKILNIPQGVTIDDIQQTLERRFAEHGDTCRIVAYGMDNGKAGGKEQVAYLLFESVAEATRALTYARSTLLIDQSLCAMEFSLQRRAKTKLSSPANGGGEGGGGEVSSTAKLLEGLPDHLQPAVWKPVERFSSPEEEKEYLDLLSKHWDKLSQEQKNYYDNCVCRALAAQRSKQGQQQPKNAATIVKNSASDSLSTSPTPPGTMSSLDSIKKRLMEKKQAAQSATEALLPTEPTTSAASLKERLALKKAQLSLAAKPSGATEVETGTATTTVAPALTSHKENVPVAVHLFYGFPIPSRFPTKTDYLTNSKSPSFRSGLIFRYVPPAVAERIVPPSARPSST